MSEAPNKSEKLFENKVWLPRKLEALAEQAATQRVRAGAGRQRSKSAVFRAAIEQYFGARAARNVSIGNQLKQVRTEAGLSLPELAAKTEDAGKKLAPSVIWRIESKERSPRLSSLEVLAKALNVSIVIDPDGVAVVGRKQ